MFEEMCWREGTGGRGGTTSVDGGKRSSILGRRVLCVYIVEYMNRRPGIRGTQVKSSMRMKKTQESSKLLFLDNLIPEIEPEAPN